MDVRSDIARLERLSTTPDLLFRLLQVVRDERSSLQDLSEVIERDQSLAHRIVATANSAYFSCPGRVNNIEQAVLLLGFELVKNLSLGMTVIRGFPDRGDGRVRQLWTHGFDVAVTAAEFCTLVPAASGGIGFLAGLLHDIGRAVLCTLYPETYSGFLEGSRLQERERECFGYDHAEVGAFFLEQVPFPAEIAASVRWHHEPGAAEHDSGIVTAVFLAESLAARSGRGEGLDDGAWDDQTERILRETGLAETDLQTVEAVLVDHGAERELYFGTGP